MEKTTKPPGFTFAGLVPELYVSNLAASLHFWCDLSGFEVVFERPEEGFAYLDRHGRQVMLEDVGVPGRHWITGLLERPFGRGVNFQIDVPDVSAVAADFARAGWPLYLLLETKAYRTGDRETVVRQFAAQDPDGYLLRFSQNIA